LIETLRLPFDFFERESELISGFNLELSSLNFILLFIIEYLEIIFFLNLTLILFFFLNYIILNIFFIYFFLWFRSFFIRFRIDLIIVFI
jgi:NADH:ubiquinone oxidoreductase subunit H